MNDYTGVKFNKITVISFSHKNKNARFWNCICDCGKERTFEIQAIKRGTTKSCGCSKSEYISKTHKKADGVAAFNNLYWTYQDNCAKKRNHQFDLTMEQFKVLLDGNCFYCNCSPSQIKKTKDNSIYIYNGIDRVDNTMGYVLENCVSCCKECNSKKSGITKDIVNKLYVWFKERE